VPIVSAHFRFFMMLASYLDERCTLVATNDIRVQFFRASSAVYMPSERHSCALCNDRERITDANHSVRPHCIKCGLYHITSHHIEETDAGLDRPLYLEK